VAVVLAAPIQPSSIHRDVIPTAYGFQELGHEVTVYAPAIDGQTVLPGMRVVVSEEGLYEPDFWRSEAPHWTLVLTWLGRGQMLRALRFAGAVVVAKGDTDGMVSARRYPWRNFQRMVLHQRGHVARARAVWHLAKRATLLHSSEISTYVEALEEAHALIVETPQAKRAFEATLAAAGYSVPGGRVLVRWNPAQIAFTRGPVPQRRPRLAAAIGRWDDPQKDPALLRRAIQRALKRDSGVRFALFGPGTERFIGLDDERVTLHGEVPHDRLAGALRRARTLVFSSRWEGLPIAAMEALACGCTVVGTKIPAFEAIQEAGGGCAVGRSAARLADAIIAELDAWERGERSAAAISERWRALVDRRRVAEGYAELFTSLAARAARRRAS